MIEDGRVGPWVVERQLGHGGMATVYRCHHAERPERRSALKILHAGAAGPERVARLARELGLLRRLDHPGVVRALDAGLHDPEPWIALELVEGAPLDVARPGARPPDEVLALGLAVADALAHAHRVGVFHRDIKPGNVLIDRQGRPRLVDLGIATSADDPAAGTAGTVGYAPPEWAGGEGRASPAATDAYGLGVLMYEQLTGGRAFGPSPAPVAILAAQRRLPHLDPGPEVPAALRQVVIGLTEARPEARATVADALGRLRAVAASRPDAEEAIGPGPLPALEPADRFVGREAELEEARRALGQGARLLVVVGPAGTGKSRFARRLVAGDGEVAFCPLAGVTDAAGVAVAVARALRVPLTDADPAAQVDRALAGRGPIRVVLDAFEHLLASVPETLARWLRAAPEAVFVVTTRERPRVAGAKVLALAPLAFPAPAAPPDEVLDSPAVRLLTARIREAEPTFRPRPELAPALAAIARAVDGLPLALELAAARAARVPPDRWTPEVAAPLALVGEGRGEEGPLRAALDWSWALLGPAEREVLAQLPVFEGGFSLDAAEAVLSPPASGSVLEALQHLVDKSLLAVVRGEGGFAMLQVVRAWAAARGPGPDEALLRRHAAFFARLAEVEDRALPPTQNEVDNAVAANEWALREGEVGLALKTADVISDAAFRLGPVLPALERLSRVLALPGGDPRDRLRTGLRRIGLLERASRLEEGRAEADALLREARALGDPLWEGRALAMVARQGWMRRPAAETLALLEEALALLGPVSRPRELARILALRANVSFSLRLPPAQARADADEAARLLEADPDPYVLAMVLGVRALVHGEGLEPVIRLARRNGYEAIHLDALCLSGVEAIRRRDHAAASSLLERAWEGARRCGFLGRQADTAGALATLALQERRWTDAGHWARQAMVLRGDTEETAHPTVCNQLGSAAAGAGDWAAADRWWAAADARLSTLPGPLQVVTLAGRVGDLAALGRPDRAREVAVRARATLDGLGLGPDSPPAAALRDAERQLEP